MRATARVWGARYRGRRSCTASSHASPASNWQSCSRNCTKSSWLGRNRVPLVDRCRADVSCGFPCPSPRAGGGGSPARRAPGCAHAAWSSSRRRTRSGTVACCVPRSPMVALYASVSVLSRSVSRFRRGRTPQDEMLPSQSRDRRRSARQTRRVVQVARSRAAT